MERVLHGACECGRCRFEVGTAPKVRFFCHCTICQDYNAKPFADVTVVRLRDVAMAEGAEIVFKTYRRRPNHKRGHCESCGKPVLEKTWDGPLGLALIPSRNLAPAARLPAPQMHLFYDHRIRDAADDLPKHTGYLPSELAACRLLLRAL